MILLERWNHRVVMTDSMTKRVNFLNEVLSWPDAPVGGEVITGRVEVIARMPDLQDMFDLVTARSFGPPSVTAECGVRFLKVGGLMVVSEPPEEGSVTRWPLSGLDQLGMESIGRVRHGAAFQVLRKIRETTEPFPRSIGIPRKHPLF